MAKAKEFAIYGRRVPFIADGRFCEEIRPERVRVMARAEGYAMVRLPGAMPFVVSDKDLTTPPTKEK